MPEVHSLHWAKLRLRWFCEQFGDGPLIDATNNVLRQYARAYIMTLIGASIS